MFWLLLYSVHTASKLSLFPTLSLPSFTVIKLGMGRKLDGDATRTADPNWPGGYFLLYDKAPAIKTKVELESRLQRGSLFVD